MVSDNVTIGCCCCGCCCCCVTESPVRGSDGLVLGGYIVGGALMGGDVVVVTTLDGTDGGAGVCCHCWLGVGPHGAVDMESPGTAAEAASSESRGSQKYRLPCLADAL